MCHPLALRCRLKQSASTMQRWPRRGRLSNEPRTRQTETERTRHMAASTNGQEYAHPEVLVTTEWVAEHLDDPTVRIVESDEDILLYEIGHIPGAVKLDWHTDLQDPVERDFVDKAGFEALMAAAGIGNDTVVIFYGDRNNWYACYTFWLFKYYGHADARIMNGGRAKWEAEGREYTRDVPQFPATSYTAKDPDPKVRAFRDDVMEFVKN